MQAACVPGCAPKVSRVEAQIRRGIRITRQPRDKIRAGVPLFVSLGIGHTGNTVSLRSCW